MSITILWKVLNLPTPSNIPQVLRSQWAKSFILSPAMAPSAKKRENIVLQFWVLYWFFIESIMFDRNCICGNKSLLPPRETTSSEVSQTLGFHPSRSNVLVFCKNISKAFASGPSASQQPENLEWQTIHKYNTLAAWLCDILFFSFLSLFDSLLSHTQKLSQTNLFKSPLTSIDWRF